MSLSAAFWYMAGLLSALAAGLVLWPLVRTGDSLAALFRGVPKWAAVAGIAGVSAALGLYLWLGRPALLGAGLPGPPAPAMTATAGGGSQPAGAMDSVVARLEARLAASGGSDGDWELLAKSYEFLNRADAAALARQHRLGAAAGQSATAATQVIDQPTIEAAPLSPAALKLVAAANAARSKRDYTAARNIYRQLAGMQQMNADTWADYADVVASLNANSLAGEPEKYLQQALRIDPRHAKALWLQASMEHETGRHAAAVATWQRLATLMDPASPDAKLIAANIREDQQLAGGATAAGISVRGDVTLEQSLRSRVVAGTTLFILAKSVNSPGAPVAVIRTATAGWPVQFELNDTQAMIPDRKLSTAGMVTIEARISQSGQALPQPGDLLGSSAALDPADGKPVHIVIQKPVG